LEIFINSRIYFGIFFLHNKFISETHLLILKRFWKADNKLGHLYMIFSGFPKPFYVLEIGFQNSFKSTVAAFQHGFWPIRTSKNLGKLLINLKEFSKKIKFSKTVSP
jgi:hypothetical protein